MICNDMVKIKKQNAAPHAAHHLLDHTILYMSSTIVAKILVLVAYPLYTFYVTPAELGVYDLIISTLALFYPVATFAINEGVFRWLMECEGDADKQRSIIAVGIKVAVRNLAVINGLAVLLYIAGLRVDYGAVMLAILNFGAIYPLLQQIARGSDHQKLFAASGVVYGLSTLVLAVIWLVWLDMGVSGLLFSQALAYFITCLFLALQLPEIKVSFWRKEAADQALEKHMMKYSAMLIPNGCWWLMNASDRYLIRIFLGDAANGIYALSHKFPSALNMITNVFTMAWQEKILAKTDTDDSVSVTKVFNGYSDMLFSLCPLLICFSKVFTRLFVSPAYESAWLYTFGLYLGDVFFALSGLLGAFYMKEKSTKMVMITNLCGAALNIAVDVALIPVFGLQAASLATLLGNALIFSLRWHHIKPLSHIHFSYLRMAVFVGVNAGVAFLLQYANTLWEICIAAACLIFFFILNGAYIKVLYTALKSKLLDRHKKEDRKK